MYFSLTSYFTILKGNNELFNYINHVIFISLRYNAKFYYIKIILTITISINLINNYVLFY